MTARDSPPAVGFLLRATARAAVLAAVDTASVGLWHPGLLAWRAQSAFSHAFFQGDRARRFDALLAARRNGQADVAFVQGDTPWHVLRRVARELALRPGARFVDVGAGQGMAAAVLATVSGASGVAVEPINALRAEATAALTALRLPVKTCARLDDVEVGTCRAAYVGWTCFEPTARDQVESALLAMPVGSRVACITHALRLAQWRPQSRFRALFPWGRDTVFVFTRA